MDFPIKHWAAFVRRHPSAFALVNANHITAKKECLRTTFSTCNFSFVFRGHGELHRLGRRWPIKAPCVFTQWPGEFLEYGPAPGTTWDELYLIYHADTKTRFESMRLIDPERPVWPIRDLPSVRAQAEALRQLAHSAEPESMADRADRVCERLILESWLSPARRNLPEGDDSVIQAILADMRARLAEPSLSPELLAARRGWSSSTFRRRWGVFMPDSPARTLQALRMQAACRLLVETKLPVHEVAARTGFADEYYFSRRFRIEQGMPPRAYRRAYLLERT